MFSGVLVLALFVSIWFLVSRLIRNSPKLPPPPGPLNLPIIGSIHRLWGTLPHISLHNLSRKYGDLLYLKLGSVPVLVASSERAAQEIFRLYNLQFSSNKFPLIAGKYLGNNCSGLVFSPYTPEVKFFRKLINTHLLSASKLKAFEGTRREDHQQLLHWIRDEQGKPVQLRKKIYEMNMNVISYMLFGKRFYGPAKSTELKNLDEFVEAIVETLVISGVFNLGDYFPALRWLQFQGLEKQYKKIVEKVNSHLMSILQERRENPPPVSTQDEPIPFIDVLISMDSTEEKLPDIVKISLLFDMMLGAVDSSAVALEWAMVELLRHPEEFSKAREEIDTVVGKERLVEESDIPKLPYIEAIAKESLRVHLGSPLIGPKIVQGGPIELNGYTIPDGTMFFVNSYSIAMDEKYWKEPFKFCPQRFIESDVDVFGQDFNLLPFGTGRRVCPGSKLGFDTLQIGIALLVQAFDWKLEDGVDPANMNMEASFGLVCHKTQPLAAIPTETRFVF